MSDLFMGVDNSEDEVFIDDSIFERLRRTIVEVEKKETYSKTLASEIDEDEGQVLRCQAAQMMRVQIEEKQVRCRKIQKQIESVQKLILAKRRVMYEVNDKLDKKKNDYEKLVEKTEKLTLQVAENAAETQKTKKITSIMNQLCAYRKAALIQEVWELFKVEIDGGPASMQPERAKRNCKCVLVDTIRGLHLPHVASIQLSPHNELETTSAIGLLIQLIDAISRILEYPLRYPVVPNSSFSRVLCPMEDKVAILSGWKKRSERERFFEGLHWLGKNIAQLRSDSGIPVVLADKTLSVLADWIRSVTEGKYVSIYDRPINSIGSPASLLINFQPSCEVIHLQSTE